MFEKPTVPTTQLRLPREEARMPIWGPELLKSEPETCFADCPSRLLDSSCIMITGYSCVLAPATRSNLTRMDKLCFVAE